MFVLFSFHDAAFNTSKWIKVTQKGSKNYFLNIFHLGGYLLYPSGINNKFTQTKKHKQMKKVLFVLALGAFAACGGENKDVKADSTAVTVDTTAVKTDSVAPVVDTTAAKADTTKK